MKSIRIGILFCGILLYLAFVKIDFSVVWHSIEQTNPLYLTIGILVFLIGLIVRAFLWRVLLNLDSPTNLYHLFKAIVVGHMGNNILPFRGGELLRVYMLKKTDNISAATALSCIAVERVFDLISLSIFTGLLSLFINIPELLRGTIVAIALLGFSVFVIIIYSINTFSLPKLIDWVLKFCPPNQRERWGMILKNLAEGLSSLKRRTNLSQVLFLSLACWGLTCFSIYWTLKAYNLNGLPVMSLSVLVILNIGFMMPMIPAALGVYQFFTILALAPFQIDKSIALGFSFILQAVDFIPPLVLGLVFISGEDIGKIFPLRLLATDKKF